jgi:chromate transporter
VAETGDGIDRPAPVSFGQALAFWCKLGFLSFGGPAGQIALMHRELVEQRRWISERRFLHALNYCMLLPGPEAQQLATYIGWLLHRTRGGIAAGALFVLPSLVLLVALSWVYVRYGQVAWVAAVFWGIKPAVVALVLQAVLRVGGRTLRTPRQAPLLWAIALGSFVAIAVLGIPFPWVVAAAALAGVAGGRWAPAQFAPAAGHGGAGTAHAAHPPALVDDDTPTPAHARWRPAALARVVAVGLALWALPLAVLAAWQGLHATLAQMALFFTKAALLTFGGAYAVLPYLVQGAVEQYGWLTGPQMIDGLALGETTPGPLIMVVAFVGFLGGWSQQVLGPDALLPGAVLAACVVTWFTFLPSFVFILAGGPLVEATHGRLGFTAPLTGVTAAVVGVIGSLALFFLRHVAWPVPGGAPDLAALGLAAAATVALVRLKLGVVTVIAACALAGLALRTAGWA